MAHQISEMKQEELHTMWPFLLRGLADIKRDLKPNWLPEDLYAALRNGNVTCVYPHRGDKRLGFIIFHKQLRVFSYVPEAFIWAGWTLPMREWEPEDEMATVVIDVMRHVAEIARTQYGTEHITWLTRPGRAKAFQRKYGWTTSWTTVEVRM